MSIFTKQGTIKYHYKKRGQYNYKRKCVLCGKDFMGIKNQKYCPQCDPAWKLKKTIKKEWQGLSCSTLGTTQELRVAVDLFYKGYDVYKGLSANSSCDLIILKNEKLIKVEVRTGYRSLSGKLKYCSTKIKADCLAVALPTEIIYLKPFKNGKLRDKFPI